MHIKTKYFYAIGKFGMESGARSQESGEHKSSSGYPVSRLALFLLFIFVTSCTRVSPEWDKLRLEHMEQDLACINEMQPLTKRCLSLDDIIEIAMENNLDLLVKQQEFEVQYQVAIRDQLRMLPALIANGELSGRNNELIVSSISVVPGVPPAPPSISTEEHVDRYDVTLVVGLLDFALNYFKSKQEISRAYKTALEYEQTRHTLIVDITREYWKAVTAKVALEKARKLVAEIQGFQKRIDVQLNEQYISRIKGLKNQADLINLHIQLNAFEHDYHEAMSALALQMGLAPCNCFELEYDAEASREVCLDDIINLENIALVQRPELYARDAEEQITIDEIRYAYMQMLPGIEFFAGDYFDANKFFFHNHWLVAGARATWNLLTLPNRYFDARVSMQRRDLVRMNRIALSIGVLSQVRLAYILYQDNYEQYNLIHSLEETNKQLLQAAENEYTGGTMNAAELLFIQSQTFFAEINALKAYGEVQVSLEQLNNAIGLPRYYNKKPTVEECELDEEKSLDNALETNIGDACE